MSWKGLTMLLGEKNIMPNKRTTAKTISNFDKPNAALPPLAILSILGQLKIEGSGTF
jgi:hypothetical protein